MKTSRSADSGAGAVRGRPAPHAPRRWAERGGPGAGGAPQAPRRGHAGGSGRRLGSAGRRLPGVAAATPGPGAAARGRHQHRFRLLPGPHPLREDQERRAAGCLAAPLTGAEEVRGAERRPRLRAEGVEGPQVSFWCPFGACRCVRLPGGCVDLEY